MTTISRLDLQNMYLEHVEAERRRIAKMIEDEINATLREILNENKMGRKVFTKKYIEQPDEFVTVIANKLQEVFTDSKISLEKLGDQNDNKIIMLSIDWTL
jgi:hypothetical protein